MIAVDPSKTSGNDRYRAAEIDCLHQADLADYPDIFIPITLGKRVQTHYIQGSPDAGRPPAPAKPPTPGRISSSIWGATDHRLRTDQRANDSQR